MHSPARAEVELDIFSGMPNPAWVLTSADAETLARRVTALPRASPCELSTGLGYRGLVVEIPRGSETPRLIRIQAGCVHVTEGETTVHVRDEGRELERWLIDTGRPQLTQSVMEVVEREVGRSGDA